MLGIINSFVHAFMYTYYFLTAFKPELKKSIWWKKHITQVQLVRSFFWHFGIVEKFSPKSPIADSVRLPAHPLPARRLLNQMLLPEVLDLGDGHSECVHAVTLRRLLREDVHQEAREAA
jgi:hypothetical protein